MSAQPRYSYPERHGQLDVPEDVRSPSSSIAFPDNQAAARGEGISAEEKNTVPASSPDHTNADPALGQHSIVRARGWIMPYAAEFFGVMVFVMFGCGANCQVNLTRNPSTSPGIEAGNWTSLSLGWGAGLAVAVWVSGGHVNPAMTLAMAIFRGFPWRLVPGFWLSQLLGGISGAAIVYGTYLRAIDINEGGREVRTLATARYFGTIPVSYLSNSECFVSEMIGTALLVISLFALLDKSKNNWRSGEVAVGIFVMFTGIASAVGAQTSFAYNPARDLGPRMLSAMVGYGRQVFTHRSWYWLYAPIIGDLLGGVIGAGIYDIFLYKDRSNIVNQILNWRDRRRGAHASEEKRATETV